MVGYPESLTDPSYRCQILTLTYPLIGNYGVPDGKKDANGLIAELESDKIWASALIVGDYVEEYSHWNAKKSLSQWLEKEEVPGISGNLIQRCNVDCTTLWPDRNFTVAKMRPDAALPRGSRGKGVNIFGRYCTYH